MALTKSKSKNNTDLENSNFVGVDFKRVPNSGTKFHNRREFQAYQEEETKFIKSVVKNEKVLRNLSKFQPEGLVQREIDCSGDRISVRFSSPLDSLCNFNLHRYACEDLVKEIKRDDDGGAKRKRPQIIAAHLRWKNGVTVKQTTGKNFRRNAIKEASNTITTSFDFGSKTKFEKTVLPNICSEFFPDDDVVILNGNNCHGETNFSNTKDSPKGGNRDSELVYQASSNYYNENSTEEPNVTVGDYYDKEERKFLLVPFSNKNGLDTDTDKRYIFPYCAKFMVTVGKEKLKYEHTFQLQLALSQTPQHYGLAFAFPVKDNEVHVVKSLISVYSMYPDSAQQCSITTYALEKESETLPRKSNPKSLLANFSYFLESNLREDSLIKTYFRREFAISCDLNKSQNNTRRQSKLDHLAVKHKNKQEILKIAKAGEA